MSSSLARPTTVLIPAFGAAPVLSACLASLAAYLPAGVAVEVLDDATPGDTVEQAVAAFRALLPGLSYIRRAANLGFLLNCNEGMRRAMERGHDVLLLNSDTRLTPGALEEMSAVLHLHEKHGSVSPRSDRATIFSVPPLEPREPEHAHAIWTAVRQELKRYHVMPTCVGFCLLLRNEVLLHFGFFDPVYSPGYNEENDLVCRMNRHGYSAVSANHAFVFHDEGASFASARASLETRHAAILNRRYPEYAPAVAHYIHSQMDPVDRFAALWDRPGSQRRKRILVDLHHIPPYHSGTSEFALNLLLPLGRLLEPEYDVEIGVDPRSRDFLDAALAGYRMFDPSRAAPFDLVFKPCQLFEWSELDRMARWGARLCCTHQDSIAVRCQYLRSPQAEFLQKHAPELLDKIIAISHASRRDDEALHGRSGNFEVIAQGASSPAPCSPGAGLHILVIGNPFHHKAVDQAVAELAGVAPLVVVGGKPQQEAVPGVRWLESGELGRAEMAGCYHDAAAIVYPSYYEGFGLPVLDGLAMGRDVIALDNEINREIGELAGSRGRSFAQGLHLTGTHAAMRAVAEGLWRDPLSRCSPPTAPLRSWADVAAAYRSSLAEVIERRLDAQRMRHRWQWVCAAGSVAAL